MQVCLFGYYGEELLSTYIFYFTFVLIDNGTLTLYDVHHINAQLWVICFILLLTRG